MVKQYCFLLFAVVYRYMETTTKGDKNLLTQLVRMPSAAFTGGHIVNPISAFYGEWNICQCSSVSFVVYQTFKHLPFGGYSQPTQVDGYVFGRFGVCFVLCLCQLA